MIYFLIVTTQLMAHALDLGDKISPAKILSVYKDNIVKMNRGSEDGIRKFDHIKLTEGNLGYVSRGFCLKVESEASWWKIYRLPDASLISKDYSYTLNGHSDAELSQERMKNYFSSKDLTTLEEADATKDLPDSI